MAAPTVGPCEPWTSEEELAKCPSCELPDDPDAVLAAIDFSSQVLFNLSGRQFTGACTRVTRPCLGTNSGCGTPGWVAGAGWLYPSVPVRLDNRWVNIGTCGGNCHFEAIELPGVVNEVTEVVIDGVAFTDFHVEGFKLLVRDDGGRWPCTQNIPLPATDEGTWQVSYTRGKPITPAMRRMASSLGCAFLSVLCPNPGDDESCLPEGIIDSIVRDDLSVTFEDDGIVELFKDGKVGIPAIDLWLDSVNPKRAKRPATVIRADDDDVFHRVT